MDGDGLKEIVVGDYYYYATVFEYTGSGDNYTEVDHFGVGYYHVWAIDTGDLNGDGAYELAFGASSYYANIEIWYAAGDNDYQLMNEYYLEYYSVYAITIGDQDADDYYEVIAGSDYHHLAVYENVPGVVSDIVWQSDTNPGVSMEWVNAIACGDVDNDTYLEVFAGGQDEYLYAFKYAGSGDDNYTLFATYLVGEEVLAIACGDVDNDTYLEVLVGSEGGLYVLNYNTTSGNLELLYSLPYSDVYGVDLCDLDGDGVPELVFSSGYYVYAYDWNGTSFEHLWNYSAYATVYSLACGDLDQDGSPEVFAGEYQYLEVLNATGAREAYGSYSGYVLDIALPDTYNGHVEDLDKDGLLEAAIVVYYSSSEGYLKIVEATGPNSYSWSVWSRTFAQAVWACDMTWDIDNNAKREVIVARTSGLIAFECTDDNTLAQAWTYDFDSPTYALCAIDRTGADLDNDTYYEIVAGTGDWISSGLYPTIHILESDVSVPLVPEFSMLAVPLLVATAVAVTYTKKRL